MNEADKKLITTFVANKPMYEAVRCFLLAGMLGDDFEKKNWVFGIDRKQSDAAYGKLVRTTSTALEWINAGFNDMLRYAPSNPQTPKPNESR